MKVCLYSLTVGEGLNKICHAVEKELQDAGVEAETIDTYAGYPKLQKIVSQNYYTIAKYIPHIARAAQHWKQNDHRKLPNNTKGFIYSKSEEKPLREILTSQYKQKQFDVLYTPVSLIAAMACQLKEEGILPCKIVYQLPDFNIPVYVEKCKTADAIVVPSQEIQDNLIRNGFEASKLYMHKIPVDTKFLQQFDKKTLRKQLNLPQDKFVCMLMSGGYGFGNTLKTLQAFQKQAPEIHYLVINGKNEAMKQNIDAFVEKKQLKNVTNLGFCKIVDQYMSASDCLYTKLGAATMCEAAAKNLIIVTNTQLLYPEYDNMLHLQKHGAIKVAKNRKSLAKAVATLSKNTDAYDKIKKSYQEQFNLHAAADIAKMIQKL